MNVWFVRKKRKRNVILETIHYTYLSVREMFLILQENCILHRNVYMNLPREMFFYKEKRILISFMFYRQRKRRKKILYAFFNIKQIVK